MSPSLKNATYNIWSGSSWEDVRDDGQGTTDPISLLVKKYLMSYTLSTRFLLAPFYPNYPFTSHSRIFHSYGDVTITSEGLQILTDSRHFWQLSSEASLSSHAYCDTGHPFIMVFSEDPWHSHLLPSAWQWNCHWLVCRDRGSTSRGERSTAGPPLRWHAYEADKSNEYTFFLSTFCLSVDFSHFLISFQNQWADFN